MEKTLIKVDEQDEGLRIDKYLSNIFKDKSRSFIQGLIEKENVKVNSKTLKSNYKLKKADEIEIMIPEPEILSVEAENIPIDIVYEDEDVIVVNKAQGMVH